MFGQGGPRPSKPVLVPTVFAVAARFVSCANRRLFIRVGLALFIAFIAQIVMAGDIRVRIAWGGGENRLWQGTIAVSEGTLAKPRLLGIEADEPGSMWIDGESKLRFQQRSARGYDGVDLLVSAPASAKLSLQFTAADQPDHPINIEIPLADLSGEFVDKELDKQGNRLLAMRTPGDLLRVRFTRDHLIFAPGESFKFNVEPRGLSLSAKDKIRVTVKLAAGKKEYWSRQQEAWADESASLAFNETVPGEEGVYDIIITAATSANWSQAVRQPLSWRKTIAERRVQLVVVNPQRPASGGSGKKFAEVLEIDPANPHWYEKLPKLQIPQLQIPRARLPRSWQGPLGNGCQRTRSHSLGELVELKPNRDSPDVSWEAYWLPLDRPGRPHVLEVEYPSDVPQTLRISILEPNADGRLTPLKVGAGFDNAKSIVAADAEPRLLRYRMVFWPRTSTPLLLIANGRDRTPAVFGKIRVLDGDDRLTGHRPAAIEANHRLLAAYLDRPLLGENFSGEESLDVWSGRCLHDWRTFHESGTRLVEYLQHAGYNGLMLSVLADGSAIYPCERLQPTPRFDTGAFFASAQDPVRKDVLEMVLRLFDRENMQLIPTVEFAATLPELEDILRRGGPEAEGIAWIGPDGKTLSETRPGQRGLAPYYNLLHPRVQEATLGVLRELLMRYAHHPSFSGLAVRLSADGYAQLPGPKWGLDDVTMARFERDTNIRVPVGGENRFAHRAAMLAEEQHRRAWLKWRAAELAKFYRRAAAELASIRPDGRLYLVGADMIGGPALEADLRPSLPRQTTVAASLLQVGIDARQLQDKAGRIVLLQPKQIVPHGDLGRRAAELEIGRMADYDTFFKGFDAAGCFFNHRPSEIQIESFNRKTPFEPGQTWIVSQPTPTDSANRRRFVRGLVALDARVMVDGGWVLSVGNEDALSGLTAAYRSLPDVHFQTVGGDRAADASQPAVFRWCSHGGRTYLYVVNDAPFPTTARIHVEAAAGCRIDELTERRKIEPLKPEAASGLYWEVQLEPYDLMAVRLSDPGARFSNPYVVWPATVDDQLAMNIRLLGARAAALRNPMPSDVVANPDFERPVEGEETIPDWAVTNRSDVEIKLEQSRQHGGRQSVKLVSGGPVACLVSRPFVPPSTGRLTISVWLRISDRSRQPPLRLALEGKLNGRDYYRYAPVGSAAGPERPIVPILSDWGQYVFQVDDLPLEGLTSLRVRFDMMGAGEVWIDDVQTFNLAFTKAEMVELSKLISLADVKLQQRQVGDCIRLLEGYWPRFLEENVPLPSSVAAAAAKPEPPKEEKTPPERSGFLNRVKDMLPETLRF